MSELEKLWKEFDAMCKTHDGCKNCEWYGPRSCAMSYMFSRNQKLKAEAVKAVKGIEISKVSSKMFSEEIQAGYNIASIEVSKNIDEAIKKIEGL